MPTVAEIIAMDMQSNEANYMRIYESVLKDEYAKLPSAAKVNLLNRKLRRLADAKSTLDSLIRDQIQADARTALQIQKDSAAAARQNARLTSEAAVAGAREADRKGDDFDDMIRKATVEGTGKRMADALIDPTRGTATGRSVTATSTKAKEGVAADIDKAMREAYPAGVGDTLSQVERLAGLESAYKTSLPSFIDKYGSDKVSPQDVALAMTEAFGFEPGVASLLADPDGVTPFLARARADATATDIAAPQVSVPGAPGAPTRAKTYADYVAEYPELTEQIAQLEADLAVEEEELFGDISILSPEDIERKASEIYTRLYGSRQTLARQERIRDIQQEVQSNLITLDPRERTAVIMAFPLTGKEKRRLIRLMGKPTRATAEEIYEISDLLDEGLTRSVDLSPRVVRELLPENITKRLGKETVTFTGGKTRDIDDVTLDDLVQYYVETDPNIDQAQAVEMYKELDVNMQQLKELAGTNPGGANMIADRLARSLREGAGLPVDEPVEEAPVTPETADIILGADAVEEDEIMAAINKSPAPSAITAPEGTVPPIGDDVGGSLAALEATQAPAPTATIPQGATPPVPPLEPTAEELEDISFAPIATDDPDDTTDLLADEEEILAPDISAELAAMGMPNTELPSVAEEKVAKRNETIALAGMTAAEIFKGIADKTATGLDLAKIAYDSYGPVKLAGTGIEQTATLTNDQLEQIYKLAEADDQSADNIKAALRNIVGQEIYDTKQQSQDLSNHVYQTLYNLRTGQINTTLE
tara:strand:- start:633 stop:2924 length:2292 start_codon:yes stop_codon:yes gene_type:complete